MQYFCRRVLKETLQHDNHLKLKQRYCHQNSDVKVKGVCSLSQPQEIKKKIDFGILLTQFRLSSVTLEVRAVFLHDLRLCGFLFVICCILSQSLAFACLGSKCRLQKWVERGEQRRFNNIPFTCQRHREDTAENHLTLSGHTRRCLTLAYRSAWRWKLFEKWQWQNA